MSSLAHHGTAQDIRCRGREPPLVLSPPLTDARRGARRRRLGDGLGRDKRYAPPIFDGACAAACRHIAGLGGHDASATVMLYDDAAGYFEASSLRRRLSGDFGGARFRDIIDTRAAMIAFDGKSRIRRACHFSYHHAMHLVTMRTKAIRRYQVHHLHASLEYRARGAISTPGWRAHDREDTPRRRLTPYRE